MFCARRFYFIVFYAYRMWWQERVRMVEKQMDSTIRNVKFSSVQFSHSVVSHSLWPDGLEHARLPCPSSAPGDYSDSCPSSRYAIQPSHSLLCPSPCAFSLSSEHSGLISFRKDWLDHLAVQGTLKSLLQNHSSKASILRYSAFFIIQLPHSYVTTGKKHSHDSNSINHTF